MHLKLYLAPDTTVSVPGVEPGSGYWTLVYVPGAEARSGYWCIYQELNLAPDTDLCTWS